VLGLGKERADGLAVGQAKGTAGQVADLVRRIEAESPVKGGGEIAGGDGVAVGVSTQPVACAVGDAAPNTAAGQYHAVAEGPVVPPGDVVVFGRTTELAHADDQGFLKLAAAAQVIDQRSERLIGWWEQVVFVPVEKVFVRIPVSQIRIVLAVERG
jgi:hypothetical protein